ncbi:ABC transporter substrate-binding protein [Acrocarpospora phusangensis]|uniref:ABC transporter substrate-binding protein n=1 Tax=Acrocarpospora phusangensis TaxID=1070424 RepID=A0A919UM45_9ACTN|nr:ABC transporter substrate-binding protein [Acrocarpospora phusangensis]GIH26614.1 ABC transporter substrate-binding protein [Acrocarpospora phusangensis]
MKRTSVKSASVILAVGLVLAGCGSGTETGPSAGGGTQGNAGGYDREAVLRWAVPGMPTSFDPRKSAPLDPVFLDVVYESLINRTPAGDIKPGLATEWQLGDENKTITFKLRQGVKFHNGEEFNAEAVKASLEAYQKEGALVGSLSGLDKVEVLAPDQVKLTFKEPSGYMINVLAGEPGIVVAPSALSDPELTGKPVGTGPFQLDTLSEGKVSFKRFDGYWDAQRTTIGGIEMAVYSDEATRLRAVKSGQADGTSITPSQIKESEASGLTVIKGANTTFNGILINTSADKLTDPKVREAMLYAIDRESISKNLYASTCTPTVQPLQQGFWANVPELNDVKPYFDIAKAKQLLAEAGYPNGFEMQLEVGPNTSYQTLAQALQAQLQQVGIKVSIKVLEFQQMVNARRTGKFTATVSLLQAGRPDPSQFVADFYLKGGLYNPGGFDLAGGAELLAQARESDDVTQRAAPMQEIFKKVLEVGPPVVPVCGITYVAAFRKGVTGMEVPVTGDYDFAPLKIVS